MEATEVLSVRMTDPEKHAVRLASAELNLTMSEFALQQIRLHPRFVELALSFAQVSPEQGQNSPVSDDGKE